MRLTDPQIETALKSASAWSLEDGAIRRTFAFPSFAEAIAFVNAVATAAEDADHHPDIDIRYRSVTLALTTHHVGGLTVKDFALAKQADALAR